MTVTSAAPPHGPVSAVVAARIAELLDEHRVVVWYDGERTFAELLLRLVEELTARGCAVVSASESALRARREADAAYRSLGGEGGPKALLVYVPVRRGKHNEDRQVDPFEGLARVGEAFGDDEHERLRALAERALPEQSAALDRLFAAGSPPLTTLDALGAAGASRAPLVRQALGTEEPADAIAQALSRSDAEAQMATVPGAVDELARLAEAALGLPAVPHEYWPALRNRLAAFVLLGELAADLPGGMPPALADVPHATGQAARLALQVCDRLRERDAGREAYVVAAREVETRYALAGALGSEPAIGARDTFERQERGRLRAVVRDAEGGDLAAARDGFAGAPRSPWRTEEGRVQIWATAERCLEFLEIAEAVEADGGRLPKKARGLIDRYVVADGLWRLDRAQRRFEQSVADCAHDAEVDELIGRCRARYLAVVGPIQAAFQAAVRAEGWPPDGVRRQSRTFDERVAPELGERRKVAYILVDSLRFEMGRDLAEALTGLGTVAVEAAAAALPTSTPNGMAALLPGVDGALALVLDGGDLVPAIGGVPLPGLKERQAYLRARLGDRYQDIELGDILQTPPKKLAKQVGGADLLVVRSLDLDDLGEGRSFFRARKVMTGVLGEIKTAIERLVAIGFATFVVVADHGHVLMPEPQAGDVIGVPAGEWFTRKRRSLLGRHRANAPGVFLLRAADVGIGSEIEGLELAVASGFKTFREDAGYFHEGLSLQECVVPILTLRAKGDAGVPGGGEQVTVTYRSDRFTSSVVGLKVALTAMFSPTLVVRLEAFDRPGGKAKRVGQASDCDARDPVTGEVTLRTNAETPVPLFVDPDFRGPSIEVRVVDPKTGVVYGTLKLKNDRLD